jgi:periplasmic divalent cation tolerance protein
MVRRGEALGKEPTEIVVMVTTANEEEAVRIGRALVEANLAACANIVPRVRSVYRWEGKLADEQEALILIKSRVELFGSLEREIVRLHSYSIPEVLAVPITAGSAKYLNWLRVETGKLLEKKSKSKTI